MELKQRGRKNKGEWTEGLNCTVMELKQERLFNIVLSDKLS